MGDGLLNSLKHSNPPGAQTPTRNLPIVSVARHDGQEHSAESRRATMPRQKRSRHLPLSRRNVPDEQERSQRHSYVEKDVLGVLNRQTATCAASCTAAESSPAAAAEHFRWPRLNRLAESNRARQSGEPDQVDWSGQGVRRRNMSGGDRLPHDAKRWADEEVPSVERGHL